METHTPKPRIKLASALREGREYVEVKFGDNDAIRLALSKEKDVLFADGNAYLPRKGFDLSGFFERYVGTAFIDYSALRGMFPKESGNRSPAIPPGYAETLRQLRYSPHTIRAYTSYFGEFQRHFAGRDLRYIRPAEINAYIVHLIDTRDISSCQQNLRINAIKFYYEKVLGKARQCYEIKRAKREKTLPDVLSKAEIKAILAVTETDIRMYCMFSLLYSAGLRISELLALKPDDINVSRMLIRVRQGKGSKDRYTLLSKPLVARLSRYRREYKPQEWMFERHKGEPFTESIVSKQLKEAAKEAGITKRVYPHLLRHSFATHLIEQGTDLKIVKELLGHKQLKTTEQYVHIADTFKSSIRTPLDDILENDNEIVK
jgi:integrase/recombinase XerD